jgi:prevent-host-death family protein
VKIGIYEAKTHFAKLIERVERGERVIITRRGKAVAEVRPPSGAPSSEEFERAIARLDERRRNRPGRRRALTAAEIVAARSEGRR